MAGFSLAERVSLITRHYPGKLITAAQLRAHYRARGIKRKFVRQVKVIPRDKQGERERERRSLIRKLDSFRRSGRKVIYLDEVVFSKLSIPKVEWSNRGHNITVDEARVRTGYVAVCAAITEGDGLEGLALQRKAFNTFEFCQFLYWLAFMNNYRPLAIFMDNLSVHRSIGARKAMDWLGIKPLFNLAYSPDYNPIEMVFSQVKHHFKKDRLQKLANGELFDSMTAADDAHYKVPAASMDRCIRHSDRLLRDLTNLA